MKHQFTPPSGEPNVRSHSTNELKESPASVSANSERLLDRLTFLEYENRRLSALVAALTLDNQVLQQLLNKP
jgi:hypothetical protein